MRNFDNIGTGIAPIINLSDVPTSEVLASAALCESVRIKITNLTPSRGPVTIPVRFIDRPVSLPMDFLEEVVAFRTDSKNRVPASPKTLLASGVIILLIYPIILLIYGK